MALCLSICHLRLNMTGAGVHLLSTADGRLCPRNYGPVGQALCNSELLAAPKLGEKPDPAAQPRPPQVSRGPALVLQALQVSRQKPTGSAVQAYSCRYAPNSPTTATQVSATTIKTVGSISTALSAKILVLALCATYSPPYMVSKAASKAGSKAASKLWSRSRLAACVINATQKQHLFFYIYCMILQNSTLPRNP